MKTVKRGHDEYKRVSDSEARRLVRFYRWAYCPKHEWKAAVRDAGKPANKEA